MIKQQGSTDSITEEERVGSYSRFILLRNDWRLIKSVQELSISK